MSKKQPLLSDDQVEHSDIKAQLCSCGIYDWNPDSLVANWMLHLQTQTAVHTHECMFYHTAWVVYNNSCEWLRQRKCMIKYLWDLFCWNVCFTVATFALCFVVMVLRRCSAPASHKWQKHLLYGLKLFKWWIFHLKNDKKGKKQRFVQQKAYALLCGSPLCLKHFKYSSIPQLTLFIWVPSESSLAFFTSKQ